jgi:beta-glucosidase
MGEEGLVTVEIPKNLPLGVGIAAHQNEGLDKNGNYPPNDWITAENQELVPPVGDAVGFYLHYKRDVDLAEELGVQIFRLSIEWSRIEPEKGKFNEEALAHYAEMLRYIKEKNMQVILTLAHFTLPAWLAEEDGWLNPNFYNYFNRFIEYIYPAFQEYVDFWVTVNEPSNWALQAYFRGHYPPFKSNAILSLKVLNNIVRTHRDAFKTIKLLSDGKAQIGLAINIPYSEPYNPSSILDRASSKFIYWLGQARFINKLIGYMDFFGLNYYSYVRLRFKPGGELLGIAEEYGVTREIEGWMETSDLGWAINPEGLYEILTRLGRYNLPIIITENGVADNRQDDQVRCRFLKQHIHAVIEAMKKGINVIGYCYWTLVDNYEWQDGWDQKFGLHALDSNGDRIARASAKLFTQMCVQRRFVL